MDRRNLLKLMSIAALPGCAQNFNRNSSDVSQLRVVVVGAGIIGASVAYHLAKAGARVMVIDQQAPASHASRATFAWINATWAKQPRHYHAFNQQGVSSWHSLQSELDLPLRWGGSLEWFSKAERQKRLVQQIDEQRQWGEPAQMVSSEELARMEPNVQFPPDWHAAYSPNDGAVDPVAATRALLNVAQQHGAKLVYPSKLVSLTNKNNRLYSVQTSVGNTRADRLVIATGAANNICKDFAGIEIPQRTTPGIITVTKPLGTRILNRVIATEAVHLHQRDDGCLIIGESTSVWKNQAHTERLKGRPNDFPDIAFARMHGSRMISKATDVLPPISRAEVEDAYIGWRPLPIDGHPVIGASPNNSDVYISIMHSGVSLAPVVGQLVSRELTQGVRLEGLANYRPERRFTGTKRY